MDELPSAEFRKVYAKLTRPTVVTVNGHVIGRYEPLAADAVRPGEPGSGSVSLTETPRRPPFSPAPKRP